MVETVSAWTNLCNKYVAQSATFQIAWRRNNHASFALNRFNVEGGSIRILDRLTEGIEIVVGDDLGDKT